MSVKGNIRPSDKDTLVMPTASGLRVKPRLSAEEYRTKLGLKRLTEFGAEIPNEVPMAPPVGYVKQPSMFENMREMVKAELARRALEEGFDTEEDDNNFDIPEENEPYSRHVYTEVDEEFVKSTHADMRKKAERPMPAPKEPSKEPSQGAPKAPREALDGAPEAPTE